MAQKVMKWFLTESGKKFTYGVACFTGVGICAIHTVPQTLLLDKYKEVVQLYNSGLPVKLMPILIERFNKAVSLLGELPEHNMEGVKPFAVFGFDMFSAGSLHSRFGGYVGIPINFTYEDKDTVEKVDIMVNNSGVNWSSDEGDQLLDSLILSENAQIYAIAREIKYLSSFKLIYQAMYATGSFISMYGIGSHLNSRFNLYSKPFAMRLFLYTSLSVFGFGLYALLTDFTQVSCDLKVDRELCETNQIFVEGGKEFYDKMLLRNRALRKLLGSHGESTYSSQGNENYYFRQKRLPLVHRRDFFAEKIKEMT